MGERMMDECYSAKPLPLCERCNKVRANTSLTFSYRGEAVTTHYYCELCCDIAWGEGVKVVEERAAKLKAIGL